jgi:membrane protease subunit (stomatin/prohibitin family)
MGFIKAFTGALSGTFADQWKDYLMPRAGVNETAVIFQAVPQAQNNGVGENTKGFNNIISNGSKIVVPEGTALITLQDGAITGFIAEPGGYEFRSNDPNSQSIFAGDGILSPLIKSSWEKVKFGGQPGSQQLAFYINLKEIAGNKFGTPETVYWDDSFLETRAGGIARGSYSIKIVDPLLFVKQYVPMKYLQSGAPTYDFADMDNESANQLFDEFVATIPGAIANASLAALENAVDTMTYIQTHKAEFSVVMDNELETEHKWSTERGIKVANINMLINYDEPTKEVLGTIRSDDAEIRKAKRLGKAFSDDMTGMMAAASAEAMKGAAKNEGGAMLGFMGMGMAQQQGANMLGAAGNIAAQQAPAEPAAAPAEDPTEKLLNAKKLLDAGAITQEDYDKLKSQILGI